MTAKSDARIVETIASLALAAIRSPPTWPRYTRAAILWQPSRVPSRVIFGPRPPLLLALLLSGVACGGSEPDPGSAKAGTKSQPAPPEKPPEPELTQEQLLDLYESAKTRVEAVTQIGDESYAQLDRDLRKVAEKAESAALRANASLLLGSVAEQRGDRRTAISFYRQATTLLPDEAEVHAVLAVALAGDAQWTDAIASQWRVVELVPDDLQAWLLLGEMQIKGGEAEAATLTYAAYELRRKGLLDGLTLKKDGQYVVGEDERVGCANALAPAADNGTALGLMYALDSESSGKVRAAIAGVMGEQRLLGYKKMLETKLPDEPDAEAREVMKWAIDEITRDGVDTTPASIPEDLAKAVEEATKKQTGELEVGLAGDAPTGEAGQPSPAPGQPPTPTQAPAAGDGTTSPPTPAPG